MKKLLAPISFARMAMLAVSVLLAASPMNVRAAAFTAGNIVIYRAGSGTGNEINTGNPVFLDEYTPAGVLVQSIAMPTTASGANKPLVCSGTATSEGLMTRSTDGRYLLVPGYGSTIPSGSSLTGSSSATVNRIIGRVDYNGNVDTSIALSDWSTGNNPRGVASTDGTVFWVGGGAGGVRYVNSPSATTSVQINTGTGVLANTRNIGIFNGQLYYSDSSTSGGNNFSVGSIGSGTPTTAGQNSSGVINIATTPPISASAYAFFFADLSGSVPGVDTLYVADDNTTSGGILKFSLVSGAWVVNGTIGSAADTYRGLTATVSGTTVTLYATRKGGSGTTGGGELVKIVDSTGYNTAPGSPTITLLATAAANTAFRGIALAPANSVTLSLNNTGTPAAGSIVTSTANVPLFGFQLNATGGSVNFTGLKLTTAGTATTSDLSNFRVIWDADSSGTFNAGDVVVSSSAQSLANPINFTFTGQSVAGTSNYLVIADVAAGATVGRTFIGSIAAAGDVTASVTPTGTAAGNQQTVAAAAYDLTMTAVSSSESTTISSLINDATITTTSQGAQAWQVTISNPVGNAGAGTITALTFSQGANNGVANWTNVLQAAELFDGSTALGAGTITATGINFSGLSTVVADNDAKTLTLQISLKSTPGALTDNTHFQFNLNGTDVTVTGNGVTTTAINSDQTQNKIDVVATKLAITIVPTYVVINTAFTVQVSAQDANGNLDLDNASSVDLSLLTGSGILSHGGAQTLTGGNIKWTTLAYDTIEVFSLQAIDDGTAGTSLTSTTSPNITAHAAPTLTEVILPQYIQGIVSGTSNSKRIPFAYCVAVSNFNPNATYRYFNQAVVATDGDTVPGAGNVIFANPSAFVESSGPSLSSVGNYGTFTTDANGSYTGWFITEPTGNAKFTNNATGNQVYMRIMFNDGAGGTSVSTRLTTASAVSVLPFGTSAGTGTGIRGNSSATAKNFVVLYDNVAGTGRPLAATFVESDGFAETANFATFYSGNVDGVAGAWGNIIPNTNPNGVQRIEQRALADGSLVGFNTNSTGAWPSGANTVSPGGSDATPIVITSGDAPLTGSVTTYTITATQSANGSITPSGVTTVNSGDSTNYSITPNVGYSVATLTVDGSTVTPATSYAFNNVTANHTITASFAINTYTVGYDGNGNTGGTAPVDASSPYNYNSTVTTKTAGSLVKTGYSFAGWNTVANGTGTGYATNATFAITANTTLFAQWTFIPVITKITVTGGNALIDFTGGTTDSTGNFTVVGTTNLTTALTPVTPPANITTSGAGLFRATLGVSNSAAFYRIKR